MQPTRVKEARNFVQLRAAKRDFHVTGPMAEWNKSRMSKPARKGFEIKVLNLKRGWEIR